MKWSWDLSWFPDPLFTWSTTVHQRAKGFPRLPVAAEVGDGQLGQLVLYPSEQPLLGRLLLAFFGLLLLVPHGHGDGIMQDKSPYQTQDQLQVPIHYGLTVCNTEMERRVTQRLPKHIEVNWSLTHKAGTNLFTIQCNMLLTILEMVTKQWSVCICTAYLKHSDLKLARLQIQSVDNNYRRHLWIKLSRWLARSSLRVFSGQNFNLKEPDEAF